MSNPEMMTLKKSHPPPSHPLITLYSPLLCTITFYFFFQKKVFPYSIFGLHFCYTLIRGRRAQPYQVIQDHPGEYVFLPTVSAVWVNTPPGGGRVIIPRR